MQYKCSPIVDFLLVFRMDMEDQAVEGKAGKLAVIIEFPSKQAAIDSYKSSEYQELKQVTLG